ncbi:GntR family transcriptional regulator [Roseibium sp. RKSG952]|uniref:GntR family transcriptional regulator n=1 Tax=Roseibium sp. RKSG952 TaxID=2529384 RepID=UPI0012BC0F1F|nr:GntR family transcriptional regulator [Roseibium sp. RKSG952]MTH96014.1 GntR family transcriptional regulator [Roseibium sp. RKSG952]
MTPTGKLPRYQKIYLLLREKILSGQLPPGSMVPSEAELAKQFGVSRITSRHALMELDQAGLVIRERGRGTTVRKDIEIAGNADERKRKAAISTQIMGQSHIVGQSDVRLLGFSRQAANDAIAEGLAVRPGSDVYGIERIRSRNGEPFCYIMAYVPIELGRKFSPAALEENRLIDLIQAAGKTIGAARQTVSATIADATLASHLDTAAGAPLLYIARTVFDTKDVPVEFVEGYFRPDRFTLSMSLDQDASWEDGVAILQEKPLPADD